MIEVAEINGHRIHMQSEQVRGEGTWHYLQCVTCKYTCPILHNHDFVTDEIGRGAKQKVRSQLSQLSEIYHSNIR